MSGEKTPRFRGIGDCGGPSEYLACDAEGRAQARRPGSLEGKLVNKTQLIDALSARYEGADVHDDILELGDAMAQRGLVVDAA